MPLAFALREDVSIERHPQRRQWSNVIGDPTTGSQAGDRTLAASANEVLCFSVILPLGTGNTSQGVTTTATFDFVAEQTANN
jgi:hypothetical protein